MKLYIGSNYDGTEIISKIPIKRYLNYETNKNDVLSYEDTQKPPHWMLDYTGVDVGKLGTAPIDVFLTIPKGSISKMFGIDMTWDDESKVIVL